MDMGEHGYSMAMLNPWSSMFHLCPMVSHGNTMGLYGNPMVFHGAQFYTHGVPWKIHGVRWKALGVPWKTQGTPWSIFVRALPLGERFQGKSSSSLVDEVSDNLI